jgi:predicted component of type VI protein secretion system
MILTLEITGPQAEKLGPAARKVFRRAGGTIGRLPGNDWALLDPYVSSRHAVIRYADGTFFIEDTSTNGVFINSQDNRLAKGRPHALKSGDWIFIEPYEIRASIDAETDDAAASPFADLFPAAQSDLPRVPAAPYDDPFAAPAVGPAPPPMRPVSPVLPVSDPFDTPLAAPGDVLDPLEALGLSPIPAPPPAPKVADLGPQSLLRDHYRPPSLIPEPVPTPAPAPGNQPLIPDDYNTRTSDSRVFPASVLPPTPVAPPPPLAPAPPVVTTPPERTPPGSVTPEQPPVPRPIRRKPVTAARLESAPPSVAAPPPAPGAPVAGDLAAVLAAAGLHDVAVTQELAQHFGRILHVVVAGVMDVLQARQRLKNEFRMGVTTFRPRDNNPLKFSANVEDALHNLLVKRNAAYLGPVEAFEDAFEDVRHHQLAMLAGMRVAFSSMLAEFDPDRLQDEFDRQLKRGGPALVPAKMRYWDLYRDKIRDMVSDAEATFRTLFGEEFAQAYEEQLRLLKAQGRPRTE